MHGLTTTDVAGALRAQNLELPGGRIDEGARDLSVRTLGRLLRPADFADLVVATRNGYAIKVRDIGEVIDGGEDPTSVSVLNGRPAVVGRDSQAERRQHRGVVDAIKRRMDEIRKTLPPTFQVRMIRDDSEFIRASLYAIEEHLIVGAIFAALVVYVFLRNFRSTIIAAIAIPTSIIGAFALMATLGFTLNQMTMLALTLMVGIVIDDAIVVLENIYRFVEEKGMSPFQAAIEGTREIGLAVMATTLSLLAVFLPVGFMGGIVGRFMSSFGLTSAAAIAISLLVSFTLTPMLAARWVRVKEDHEHYEVSRKGFYGTIDRVYTRLLEFSMAHRWAVVITCAIVVLSTYPLFKASGLNFVPDEDESRFQVFARLPVGSSLAATQSLLDRIARDLREKIPGVSDTLAISAFGRGGGQANTGHRLRTAGANRRSRALAVGSRRHGPSLIRPYRKEALVTVQGTSSSVFQRGSGPSGGGIQYALSGPDLDKLDRYSAKAVELIDQNPAIVDVTRSYVPGRPELRVVIDRKRAADLGIRVEDVSQTVNALMAGQRVTTFNAASDQYDVMLKAQDAFRRAPETLSAATVRTASGELVQLRNLVTLDQGEGPASIDRLNRQRQITMSANWAPGHSQAEAQRIIQDTFAGLNMEPGYSLVASGQSRELGNAIYYFGIAFALSFVFMYMVLAAQFESFIHPVTILLTLPLSVPFGLLASIASAQDLNIYSALGVLLLFGIVKKNAILQIDHTIGLRAQGLPDTRQSSRRIATGCGRS